MEPGSPVTVEPLTVRERLTDWWHFSEKKYAFSVICAGLMLSLITCAALLARGPEQVPVEVPVLTKASLVTVIAARGEDLGTIGAKDGVSRITMVGLNIELIRKNTLRCGDKRNGNCRRDDFGEEKDLAFDAMWEGDPVLTIKEGTLDYAFASTTTR